MGQKIKIFVQKYREILLYLIFGGLTTMVSYLVYLPCYNLWGCTAALSNALSWIASVAFAFVTNKPFVFKSRDWSAGTVLRELAKFVGARLGSGLTETGLLLIFVDLLHFNGNVCKIATSVLVVVFNYVASKLLVFRNKG